MLINFKRVFNFAITDSYRNKDISLAAVFVLTVTTLIFTALLFFHGISSYLILTIQNKIDITAYFKEGVEEQSILDIKDQLLKLSVDIKNVQYVSKEDALAEFKEKHNEDNIFSKALAEVGENPFLPSLNINTTGDPALYEEVSKILQQDQFISLIEKIDFLQKKDTIEKVFSIISNINRFSVGLGSVLVLIAVIVVFSTIKLVIDKSREEISNMRIVGASNWFIRAPFIIEGGIFGFMAFIFCFFITVISVYFLSPAIASIVPGFNLLGYFISNIWLVILIQLVSGAGSGAVFSFIAVRKYLSV